MERHPSLAIYAGQEDLAYFCAQLSVLFEGRDLHFIAPSSILDQRAFSIQRTEECLRIWAQGIRDQNWHCVIGRIRREQPSQFYGASPDHPAWQSIPLPEDAPPGPAIALGAVWRERIMCYVFCSGLPLGPPEYIAMPWVPRSRRRTAQLRLPPGLGGEVDVALPASFDDTIRT